MKPPAPNPCGSCPYRKDVPSGIWDKSEYEKLPEYDGPTYAQPPGVFLCHQQDGRLCAGWVGCHDMGESLAFRIACASISRADAAEILNYKTAVPLFKSGAAAATHGMKAIRRPGRKAKNVMENLLVKGKVKLQS